MKAALRRHGVNLAPGTVIKGSWHGNEYRVLKKLGQGVVGTVYLVKGKTSYQALKMSRQSASITQEVNVLKRLQRVQGKALGPLLVDVDDFKQAKGLSYSFYVMEYVKGKNIRSFIKSSGAEWLGVFLLQILYKLERLHKAGYVFGDLKVDHLLVEPSPPKVRLIDFGGATKRDRAVKEFTEFYDRGYWKLGSRQAEPSYDLFSLVLLLLHIFHPAEFSRGDQPKRTLFQKIENTPELKFCEPVLKRALIGRYNHAEEMAEDLQREIFRGGRETLKDQLAPQQRGVKSFLLEVMILLVIISIYSVIVYLHV